MNTLKKRFPMNTILINDDIDIYMLDFFTIQDCKKYMCLSKKTFAIFKESKYSRELNLYYEKFKYLLDMTNIYENKLMNLFTIFIKGIDNITLSNNELHVYLEDVNLKPAKFVISLSNIKIDIKMINIITLRNHFPLLKFMLYLGNYNRKLVNIAVRAASREGHLNILKYLREGLPYGSRADLCENDNYALRWACRKGHAQVAIYLVTQGADTCALNNYAIRHAAENGHFEVVHYLFAMGVNIRTHNDYVYKIALQKNYTDIIELCSKIIE